MSVVVPSPDQLIAAVDIGGTKATAALVHPSDGIVGTTSMPTGTDVSSAEVVTRLATAIGDLRRTAGGASAAKGSVVAAGVVTPGVVSPRGIALAPNNPGMDTITADALRTALGVPALEWSNDVKAAALAEHAWGSLAGARSGLYINLGTGLAAGAVIDGRPLLGAHGAALEIGYLLPTGPMGAGHRSGAAPLEDRISGRGLQDRATAAGHAGLTASAVVHGHGPGETALVELAADFTEELVRAVVNLAITLDSDAICFGGGMAAGIGGGMAAGIGGAADVFLDPVRSALAEYAPYPPRVSLSTRPDQSSLFGAIRIACAAAGWPTDSLPNPYA
ncbi:ROK family protein [Curtobacterium ammoniigenes]|uniref:ROK family protein n=1 Tax=Curtobacterium ammoniigenes TaxID=395387 RepID=UPI00146FE76B|nr:ROK family protein [Curtobacterium ammoniigenes]